MSNGIIQDYKLLKETLVSIWKIMQPAWQEAKPHTEAFMSLVNYYQEGTGTIFEYEAIPKIEQGEMNTEFLEGILRGLSESLDWAMLYSRDNVLYRNLEITLDSLRALHYLAEENDKLTRAMAKSAEKEKKNKKVRKIEKEKAQETINYFLNGEWITSLLVQRPGERKGTNDYIPETYGDYSPSRNEAVCYLLDHTEYNYMPRSMAFNEWFASQIKSYANHLRGQASGKVNKTSESSAESYLHDLLSGIVSPRSNSSEKDWSCGYKVQVTFTGKNLPGVALRVDPVKFTDEEIQEMATQIIELQKMAKKAKNLSTTPDHLSYGENINVKMAAHLNTFDAPINIFDRFDLGLLNIDRSAESLVKQIKGVLAKPPEERPDLISMLFYGIPGSGKSRLASYLGHAIGKPVIKKTYAELQSMYVSEGEKQLSEAFQEAEMEDAILLIDEIDSIAVSRQKADRNYQKTFVNQLLTELDDFKGIFIATSNSMDSLDAAVLRRLFLKVEFNFLNEDQLQKCFELYFPKLKRYKLGYIPYLTPGDFYAVSEASRYEPGKVSLARVRELLNREVKLKKSTLAEVIKAERKSGYDL